MNPEVLQKRLARSQQRVAVMEGMIEDATRALYLSNEELRENVGYLEKLQEMLPTAVLVVGEDRLVRSANQAASALLGHDATALRDTPLEEIWREAPSHLHGVAHSEVTWLGCGNSKITVLVSAASVDANENHGDIVVVATDIRERKRLEIELRHAQKLESVGQLSAGIAHEINTPMQFVGDNVDFIQEACEALLALVEESARIAGPGAAAKLEEAQDEADLDFIRTRLPKALSRTVDGIKRVTSIVAAMKAFSHPAKTKAPSDLNTALETTLTVATNEYRYVADVECDFGDLPLVHCNLGDLGQVFLNLIVNASHAIQERQQDGDRGVIRVATKLDGDMAEIQISDTGCGIPEAARERIFEPFFTTKKVGKGTGQGLALAFAIITERHGGTLTFETVLGSGTTFFIRVPVGNEETQTQAA